MAYDNKFKEKCVKNHDFSIASVLKIKNPPFVSGTISEITRQKSIAIIIPFGIPTIPPSIRFSFPTMLKENTPFKNFARIFTRKISITIISMPYKTASSFATIGFTTPCEAAFAALSAPLPILSLMLLFMLSFEKPALSEYFLINSGRAFQVSSVIWVTLSPVALL